MSKIDIMKNKVSKKINSICLFKMDMSKIDIIRFIPLMVLFPVRVRFEIKKEQLALPPLPPP